MAGLLAVPFVFGISVAAAQRPTDSEDALFGADRTPDVSRSMDLTVSISGARDDDLGADQGMPSPIEERVGGSYSDWSALLSLGLKHKRLTLGSYAYGLVRHYPRLDNFVGSNFSAHTDLAITLGRRTVFSTAADANSASNFAFDTFNRQTRIRADEDWQSFSADMTSAARQMGLDWTSRSYGVRGNLTRTVSSRQSFSLITEGRRTEGPFPKSRTDEYLVMAQLRHSIGHGTSVQFEYDFRQGAQKLIAHRHPFSTHDALARVEHQWRHSRLRRTGISLAGGPSYLRQHANDAEVSAPPATLIQAAPHAQPLRAIGMAIVTHDFTNRWNAQLSIRRGVGLGQAGLYSGMATLDVRGTFGPRVGVELRAGHTAGDMDPIGVDTRNENSFAASQLQVAFSQSVAVYGQYFFHHYVLAGSRLNRVGFRVGLSFWAPLWRAVTA